MAEEPRPKSKSEFSSAASSRADSQSADVAILAQDYIDRCRAGERPTLEEYVEQHPGLEEQIRDVFPMLLLMEDMAAPPEEQKELEFASFGDFEIHRELGRGGMATVYEATQRSLGRRVALKVCPIAQSAGGLSPTASRNSERFRRESRAAALLHHNNIAPVFAVGEEQGFLYYCMQLIDGATLDEVIAELKRVWKSTENGSVRIDSALVQKSRDSLGRQDSIGKISPEVGFVSVEPEEVPSETRLQQGQASHAKKARGEEAWGNSSHSVWGEESTGRSRRSAYWDSVARIGSQVADALAYAHSRGTLHRDVKPSNLMLDETGSVWVMDFGLAKSSEEDDLTHSGEMIGTLRYVSPEQSRGAATELSDVFSLGLTMYELLTLRPAYEAVNRTELIRMMAESEPPVPRRINSQVPRDLETIVLKACEREPSRRYPSARAMQEDFARFLAGEPIQARPISVVGRVAKWVKRRPQVASLLAVLAVVFIGSFALVTWKWRDAESQRTLAVQLANAERNARADERKARSDEREQFATTNEVNDFLARILRAARPEAAGESVRVIDVMDALQPEIEARFSRQPRIRGMIRREFGSTYRTLGDDEAAEFQFRKSVEALMQIRPLNEVDELELLDSQDKLAGVLRSRGGSARVQEAEQLRRGVLERRRELLGSLHPMTVRAMGNLGVLLDQKGDFVEARELFEQALDGLKQDPEHDLDELVVARHNIIRLLEGEGKLGEAIEDLQDLIQENAHRPHEIPILVQLPNTLGQMCQTAGRFVEAEQAFRQALEEHNEFYGEGHSNTLSVMRKLTRLLVDMREPSKALELLLRCVELHNEQVGSGAGLTFGVRRYVALAYEQLNELEKARAYLRETREILSVERGVEHKYTREAESLIDEFNARHP